MKKSNKKKEANSFQRGITLIEILVSIAIIGVLTGTVVVNFRGNEDRDVRSNQDSFMAFLREVQNKAVTGDREGISTSGKLCGFGIHFVSDNHVEVYYIRLSGSGWFNTECSLISNRLSDGGASLEDFYLKDGVIFENIDALDDQDIFFLIPSGESYLAGDNGGTLINASYPISLSKGSSAGTVSIEPAGNIK